MAKPTKPTATRRKSTAKTTAPAKVPQPHGGALNAGGTPGNAGGGRPPNWLKEWCDDLLADADCKKQVEAILKDKGHSAYAAMWRAVADRAHGKPTESVTVTGEVTHKHQVWRFGEQEVAF